MQHQHTPVLTVEELGIHMKNVTKLANQKPASHANTRHKQKMNEFSKHIFLDSQTATTKWPSFLLTKIKFATQESETGDLRHEVSTAENVALRVWES